MVLPFPFMGGGGGGKLVWTHTQEESQRGALSVDQRGMIYTPGPLHTLCSSRTLPPLQGVTTGPGRPQQARSISSRAPSWVLGLPPGDRYALMRQAWNCIGCCRHVGSCGGSLWHRCRSIILQGLEEWEAG